MRLETVGQVTTVELVIIRHGQTPGNAAKRYVGALDQPLSEQGRAEALAAGVCPNVKRVYVTTLQRTHETASICFPNAEQVEVEGLQEMNFGDFANRSADEMADDEAYRAWVDGMCLGACPNGESRAEFTQRICQALAELVRRARSRKEKRIILVAHGGTMMAALSTYAVDREGREYYDWLVGNCEGWRMDVQTTKGGTLMLKNLERVTDLRILDE